MAAQGLTNAEVAQELFITTKTVEAHLGRAYRKLGIAGRPELRAALGLTLPGAASRDRR
jgi:DNA-binding CsgD family transcriptional regulator